MASQHGAEKKKTQGGKTVCIILRLISLMMVEVPLMFLEVVIMFSKTSIFAMTWVLEHAHVGSFLAENMKTTLSSEYHIFCMILSGK